ncbi:hypothetical protein L596_008780 [Steinernema carpocapsae]|uniref:G-protein coupled receptors family 1 profile domain-containing protein n=1 Tax=Steinernema carpocapsae TaxID=34508 RepID=A0A4V6A6E6_STECR|nr:hypothetical protein L596_008780 [Steinernema carpocapsae]
MTEDLFKQEAQHIALVAVNSFVILFSLCGLILYRKRSYTTKNYGLIETLFGTHIVYGLLTIASSALWLLPIQIFFEKIVFNQKLFLICLLTPHIAEQIVTVNAILMALDRTLIMTTGLSYGTRKIGKRLSILSIVLNMVIMILLYGSAATAPSHKNEMLVFEAHKLMVHCIFPITLLVEFAFYVIFVVVFQRFYNRTNKGKSCKTALTVHFIVLVQVGTHTFLSTIPNLLTALNSKYVDLHLHLASSFETYNHVLFAVSVLLSLLFTLCRLKITGQIIKPTVVQRI